MKVLEKFNPDSLRIHAGTNSLSYSGIELKVVAILTPTFFSC
ncbi:MAG: hypothetical protein PVJ97_02375 [Flavobacteriaceae bacterium]|jgi:hypothetical protein